MNFKYLSKFNNIKNNDLYDVVFITIFIVLLFIPISHISNEIKSEQENRMLAKKPKLINNNGLFNYNFGKQFDSWFNDRFFGREKLLDIHNSINKFLYKYYKNNKTFINKNDMTFGFGNIYNLLKPLTDKELKNISYNLNRLKFFCDKNNIKLYIMIVPSKEEIWDNEISYIKQNSIKNTALMKNLKEYIKQKNNLDIIYSLELFLKDYNEFTYFKTDHHWTEFGAFLGYQEIMKEIQKDFPNINILKEDDFTTFYKNISANFPNVFKRNYYFGSGYRYLNLDDKKYAIKYNFKFFNHKNESELLVIDSPIKSAGISYYKNGYNKNLVILGNSMIGYFTRFFPYNFKNTHIIMANNGEKGVKNFFNMKRFEKHILDFKTDILIFCIHSPIIRELQNLYPRG